jgi:hypothetical protein
MPDVNSLSFDTTGLRLVQDEPARKIWHSLLGDGIGLDCFRIPPDLPKDAKSLDDLRRFYIGAIGNSGARLVSLALGELGKCRAIELIIKAPQQPSGMTYVGSFTIPFRDFSFVVKSQCEERGTTGLREATLADRLLKAGKIRFDPVARRITGEWDPDHEKYDSEFPVHPLSRLRAILGQVEETGVFDESILYETRFPLP